MARYQILYWKSIPSLIRSEDATGEIQVPMGDRFEKLIDATATREGLTGTDEYLDQWQWGDELERPGTAAEVAGSVQRELEAQHPSD